MKQSKAWTQEEAAKAVEVWQTSNTKQDAAKKLGMKLSVLEYRIQQLKKRGVKDIKKFPSYNESFRTLDIEFLNNLAKKHLHVKIK